MAEGYWVLVCWGLVGVASPPELDGAYLESYDVEAHEGRGTAVWTRDLAKALHFPSFETAIRTWQLRSTTVPWRPDNKPNRPLTAFSVEPRLIDG